MDWSEFAASPVFHTWILPILIFLARIGDVSVGTLRIIFLARDKKMLAPLLGFVEVLIWLVAVGQIIQNLTSPALYIAYAGGYAMGNYIGMLIESKIAIGSVIMRVITRTDAGEMIDYLIEKGYRVTHIEAEGVQGKVHIIFMALKRRSLPAVMESIKQFHPQAFFSIEDVRQVQEAVAPQTLVPTVIDPVLRK